VVIGPVVPGIMDAYGVSRGAVGLGLTAMWVAYALVQLPSGLLGDRHGDRLTVLGALSLTAAATLAVAAAPTFLAFGVAVAALGVGAGVYYNPATSLLDRTSEGVGGAIGVHRVGGQAAGVVAPAGAAVLVPWYGWRVTVGLGLASVGAAALLFGRWTAGADRRTDEAPAAVPVDLSLLGRLLARRHTRQTTAAMSLVEFVGLAAMSFLPTLLIEHHGFGDQAANVAFAAFFATAALAQPVAGHLSDRVGRDSTVAVVAGVGVLGYGGLAVAGRPLLAVAGTVLAGASMSATPVVQSRMLDGLEAAERGVGFGVFRTVYLLLGATGTAVVGTVADGAGWGWAAGLLSALFGAVCLLALRGRSAPGAAATR
jgi:MFS family permease